MLGVLFFTLTSRTHRGYVAQTQDGGYRVVSRPKKMLFGFAESERGDAVLIGSDSQT